MWACAIVILNMFMLQQIILTLDIIPDGVPMHRLGPCALWFAYFAAVIEYKRWYDVEWQQVGFVLVYIAYFIHIVYTIQLYRLCRPSGEAPQVAETPGATWWPGEWKLPVAFQHSIWLVAPPKKLQEHEVDIVGELRAMQQGHEAPPARDESAAAKRHDVHRALGVQGESPAWFSVKVGLISLILAWCWLVAGFTWEVMNQGTTHPSFLSAPGNPNNARDPRYRPAKLGKKEPPEVGTGGIHGPAEGVHMEGMHRRLSDLSAAGVDRRGVAAKLRDLLPLLHGLAEGVLPAAEVAAALPAAPEHTPVQWPAWFEPSMLACGAEAAVALSRHGRGAHILPGSLDAQPFALHGAAGHGALTSASWDGQGLLASTASGGVLHCAGAAPVGGRWLCEALEGARLPVGASAKVALSRMASGALRAAVLFPGEGSVTLYLHGTHRGAKWLIQGEVRSPAATVAASFAGEGHLLLASADGSVSKLHLADGSRAQIREANAGHAGHAWAAVCQSEQSSSLLRLATQAGTAAKLIFG